MFFFFFFFNDTATTEIYTLSLHAALPISDSDDFVVAFAVGDRAVEVLLLDLDALFFGGVDKLVLRSEEHTSELQSQSNLVCRLLLEKKKKTINRHHSS